MKFGLSRVCRCRRACLEAGFLSHHDDTQAWVVAQEIAINKQKSIAYNQMHETIIEEITRKNAMASDAVLIVPHAGLGKNPLSRHTPGLRGRNLAAIGAVSTQLPMPMR